MKTSSETSSPSSRSMTQSITGRPATLSRGFGTRWVCGLSRVPLPASGMMTCTSAPSVTVAQADQVIQLGRRGLEHVGVGDGFDLVDHTCTNAYRLTGAEGPLFQLLPGSDPEDQLSGEDVHGF